LEDVQGAARGAGVRRRVRSPRRRRRRHLPGVHGTRRCRRIGAHDVCAERALGGRGGFHRRGLGSDAPRARRARRTAAALEGGLGVIACVGESEEERESGQTELVLRVQVEAIRDAVGAHERLVIAYEPVWAIGTGKTATPAQAQEAHAFIKSLIHAPVLYGGSVKPENADELLSQDDVDGALVGGASLEVDSLTAICESAARIPS
jgi:triosephosphate isomerase (TIM)